MITSATSVPNTNPAHGRRSAQGVQLASRTHLQPAIGGTSRRPFHPYLGHKPKQSFVLHPLPTTTFTCRYLEGGCELLSPQFITRSLHGHHTVITCPHAGTTASWTPTRSRVSSVQNDQSWGAPQPAPHEGRPLKQRKCLGDTRNTHHTAPAMRNPRPHYHTNF